MYSNSYNLLMYCIRCCVIHPHPPTHTHTHAHAHAHTHRHNDGISIVNWEIQLIKFLKLASNFVRLFGFFLFLLYDNNNNNNIQNDHFGNYLMDQLDHLVVKKKISNVVEYIVFLTNEINKTKKCLMDLFMIT